MGGCVTYPSVFTVSAMAGTGTPTHPPSIVAVSKDALDQALAEAGLTPSGESIPESRRVRHLTLIQGGRQ